MKRIFGTLPKPLVLAAFFPPFLSLQKEREPPEAWRFLAGAAQGKRIAAPVTSVTGSQ